MKNDGLSLESAAALIGEHRIRRCDKPLETGPRICWASAATGHGPDVAEPIAMSSVPLKQQPDLIGPQSRFGVERRLMQKLRPPKLRELGIGAVRFENGKWPFVSAQPHEYSFTGEEWLPGI